MTRAPEASPSARARPNENRFTGRVTAHLVAWCHHLISGFTISPVIGQGNPQRPRVSRQVHVGPSAHLLAME
jgi:hypothetical protein